MVKIGSLFLIVWGVAQLQAQRWSKSLLDPLFPGVAEAYTSYIPEQLKTEAIQSESETLNRLATLPSPASIDSSLTLAFAVMPALMLLAFAISAMVVSNRTHVGIILWMALIGGASFSFVGIADSLAMNNSNPIDNSLLTPEDARSAFSSFINRNNAAGYLNLSLAAGFGCLALTTRRRAEPFVGPQGSRPRRRIARWCGQVIEQITPLTIVVILLVILNAVGIFVSGSRGGGLGVFAGTVASLLLTRNSASKNWRPILIVFVILGAIGLLGLTEVTQDVGNRFKSILQYEERDPRLGYWPDGLTAAWNYFPGGAGLGTYRFAYLPFQSSSGALWAVNADGMPVEWLVEGGLWLGIIVGILVLQLVFTLQSLSRKASSSVNAAAIATGWFALGSMLVSQVFDFGITIPAVYLLFSILVGMIVGVSEMEPTLRSKLSLRIVAGIAIAIVATFTIRQTRSDAFVEANSFSMQDQAELKLEMSAEGHLRIVSAILADQTDLVLQNEDKDPGIPIEQYLNYVGVSGRRIAYYRQLPVHPGDTPLPPEAILYPEQSVKQFELARQHAIAALFKSPLSAEAHFRLVQLDFVAPTGSSCSKILLRQIAMLRSRNLQVLLRIFKLALVHPGPDVAYEISRQLITLSPSSAESVWRLLLENNLPDAVDALPANTETYVLILEKFPRMSTKIRDSVIDRAISLNDASRSEPISFSEHVAKAKIAILVGENENAIENFARAVELNPAATTVRFQYVQVLEAAGQIELAIQQIERCILQDSTNQSYQEQDRQLRLMLAKQP